METDGANVQFHDKIIIVWSVHCVRSTYGTTQSIRHVELLVLRLFDLHLIFLIDLPA